MQLLFREKLHKKYKGQKYVSTINANIAFDSYEASDDIEVGNENKIPLWLFGFLY